MSDLDAAELVEQVQRLARDFPLPHPRWHRYVAQMHEVVDDLVAAIDAVAASPAARDELVRRVEAGRHEAVEAVGSDLAAAQRRLRALPVPEGEHPYLDEIVPALEAADATLAALASVAGGEPAFVAARRRLAAAS